MNLKWIRKLQKGKETLINVPKVIGNNWRDVTVVEVVYDGEKLTVTPIAPTV